MPHNLFLLFNHTLTVDQEEDARVSLGTKTIAMPDVVKQTWAQIPPDSPTIYSLLQPVRNWLISEASPGDYVLIQGDFGACCLMVNFAFENGLVPVYSTTERLVSEEKQQDGSVNIVRIFSHKIFRKYEGNDRI